MLGENPHDITEVGVVLLREVGGVTMDAIGVPPNQDGIEGVGEPPVSGRWKC